MKSQYLSIFIDESGTLGGKSHKSSTYYLLSFVFHDQDKSISKAVEILDTQLKTVRFGKGVIHCGPLIRREERYKLATRDERFALFTTFFKVLIDLPISYYTLSLTKDYSDNTISLLAKMSKELSTFLIADFATFSSFKKIVVYYDNGQSEITKMLASVFPVIFSSVEFKHQNENGLNIKEYLLFQVADLICTTELVATKLERGTPLSNSEMQFFGSPRKIKNPAASNGVLTP